MSPTNSNENDVMSIVVDRLTKIDEKFDLLRTELMASFVLKQVFDVWSRDLERRMNDAENNQKNRVKDFVAMGGGLFGLFTGLVYLITFLIQHIPH